MRIVVDTNVIVSGLLRAFGFPARVLATNDADDVVWITSEALLAEAQRVLARPHIRRSLLWDDQRILLYVGLLRRGSIVVDPTMSVDVSRDADDNRVLKAAVAGPRTTSSREMAISSRSRRTEASRSSRQLSS